MKATKMLSTIANYKVYSFPCFIHCVTTFKFFTIPKSLVAMTTIMINNLNILSAISAHPFFCRTCYFCQKRIHSNIFQMTSRINELGLYFRYHSFSLV